MANSPNVIRTPLASILPLVQAQVQKLTGFPTERVGLLGRGHAPPHFQGDQDVYLRPLGPSPEEGWVAGSGRLASVVLRPLRVVLRSRLDVDLSYTDTTILLDPTFGHLALEETILNALHLWLPIDPSSNALLIEPMRLMPSPDLDLDPEPAPGKWVQSQFHFEVKYFISLDQTRIV